MGRVFGVGDCKKSCYKCLCKRVGFYFIFYFLLVRCSELRTDRVQY